MAIARQDHCVRQCRRIGHVDVDVETAPGAVGRLVSAISDGRPGIWGFCNAHTVNLAASDLSFREAIRTMTMFNDGVGVDIASRYLYGKPFPENLNGTDLTPALLAALPSGTSVFLVGGRADVARAAAEKVSSTFSHVRVVGYHHGYFGSSEQHDVVQRIVETDARFVMVGMGQPRQEIWAASNANILNMPVLCIGAQIDRFAGLIPRAPLWMRQMKMEWLYRLFLEPRRLAGRYLWGNFIFLARVIFGQRNVRGEG